MGIFSLDQCASAEFWEQWKSTKEVIFIILSCTINGQPPQSAKKYCSWLKQLCLQKDQKTFQGIFFAIFGCGNSEYPGYQLVPRTIDRQLEILGMIFL